MSHEIVNAVFSSREGAGWTGLGQVIPSEIAKDPTEIAKLCGATYNVEKRACYFQASDGSYIKADGREVLVRSDTNAMLEVVSDTRYHVQNRQPIDIFAAFRDELAMHGLEISHGAVLRGGAVIAVCAMLPAEYDIAVGGRDPVKSYVTLSTGYDGKHGTKASKGTIRVVCANTLAASIAQGAGKDQLRTVRASTLLEETSLAALIARVKDLVEDERSTFDRLVNASMSNVEVSRYFADVLEINVEDLDKRTANGKDRVSTKSRNMLRELAAAYANAPGAAAASGSAWGALNAVTYYATHIKTVRDTSGSGEDAARVASNLSGDAVRLKVRALELAASYANRVAA